MYLSLFLITKINIIINTYNHFSFPLIDIFEDGNTDIGYDDF